MKGTKCQNNVIGIHFGIKESRKLFVQIILWESGCLEFFLVAQYMPELYKLFCVYVGVWVCVFSRCDACDVYYIIHSQLKLKVIHQMSLFFILLLVVFSFLVYVMLRKLQKCIQMFEFLEIWYFLNIEMLCSLFIISFHCISEF